MVDRATSPLTDVLPFQRTRLLMTAYGSLSAASSGRKGRRYRIFCKEASQIKNNRHISTSMAKIKTDRYVLNSYTT
jgi:hypothetical protein